MVFVNTSVLLTNLPQGNLMIFQVNVLDKQDATTNISKNCKGILGKSIFFRLFTAYCNKINACRNDDV